MDIFYRVGFIIFRLASWCFRLFFLGFMIFGSRYRLFCYGENDGFYYFFGVRYGKRLVSAIFKDRVVINILLGI